MRNIRTKRVRTQVTNFFAQPFQESVLEIELEKHYKCLLQIQKNHFDKANLLLQSIVNEDSSISIAYRDKAMLKSLTVSVKSYLLHRQGKYDEAILCLQEGKQSKNKYDNPIKMRSVLGLLVKSAIWSKVGRFDQARLEIQQAFQIVRTQKDHHFYFGNAKNMETYHQIFIIFFDMVILELSRLLKFEEISSIYREGYQLSDKILGKDHKLTQLMRKIIIENIKDRSVSSRKSGSFKEFSTPVRTLYSKRKLKVNEEKIHILSTKEREMKRIYHDNDESLLGKMTVYNRMTKKDENSYLRSLEKVKSIYNSRNKDRDLTKTDLMERSQDAMNDASRKRIKDIILKGRRLNRNKIYSESENTRTEANFETTTIEHRQNLTNFESSFCEPDLKQKEKTHKVAQLPKELTFTELAKKVQATQQNKQQCQLI